MVTSADVYRQLITAVNDQDLAQAALYVLGQMRQLYGKALGVVGLSAMFFRL